MRSITGYFKNPTLEFDKIRTLHKDLFGLQPEYEKHILLRESKTFLGKQFFV
jgi:hypothetical protein